jgi:hypothetical protein
MGMPQKYFSTFYKEIFMVDKLNATVPLQGKDGKTYWHNIGKAFQNKLGGWDIILNSLPIPQKDQNGNIITKVMLLPQKDNPGQSSSPQSNSLPNDNVPF